MAVGNPPKWHRCPFSDFEWSSTIHWSRIPDFSRGADIRVIWEVNRFAFVYPLVRWYRRSGDEECADLFWNWIEDWREKNPPNAGVNWKCGQETAFRLMAWVFGLYGFLDSTASTEHRISELVQMIIFSARRIEGNLGYALAQKNNHGISEATGLWTVALLFPKARGAQLWRHRAKQLLESQARELIYKDGAFAQHSANYHRVMLQDYLWSVALGRLNGESFAPDVVQRLRSCCAFLYALQQGRDGEVPLTASVTVR